MAVWVDELHQLRRLCLWVGVAADVCYLQEAAEGGASLVGRHKVGWCDDVLQLPMADGEEDLAGHMAHVHHTDVEVLRVSHPVVLDHVDSGLRSCTLHVVAGHLANHRSGEGPCRRCHRQAQVGGPVVCHEQCGGLVRANLQSAGDLQVVQASGVP